MLSFEAVEEFTDRVLELINIGKEHGNDHECQQRRCSEAADDGDRHRAASFSRGA